MPNLKTLIINRNNLFQSILYDPSVTQLGHIDRNFIKFYAILCNFTTKNTQLWVLTLLMGRIMGFLVIP